MKRTIYLTILFLLALTFQIQAQTETKVFRGNIADNRIQMNLKRDGKTLSGTYLYQKVGKDLRLSGAIDAEGNFRLTETDARGVKTGEFEGKWKEDESGGITLEGEWKNPKTRESWAFYAQEEIIEFSGGARLLGKTFSEKNKPKWFEITAEYPELAGASPAVAAKFNQLVKNKVMNSVGSFRKSMLSQTAEDLKFTKERGINNYLETGYVVEFANDDVISIGFFTSVYSGGAHPNHFTFPVNFDLKNGREIKLADLFKPNSNYLKVISDYSIRKLKEQMEEMTDDDWIKEGAGPNAQNFDSWNIKRGGILITFDPYQVAAYAAGPQEVFIPFSELKNILREKSAVAGLIKK